MATLTIAPPHDRDPARPDALAGGASTVVRRPGLVVFVMCASAAMVLCVVSGVTAALPAIGRDLRTSQTELQWIGDSYPLVLATLLLPGGLVLDRLGRRRGMLVGFVLLAGGLVWAGVATGTGGLLAARCVAGVGAALVFPGTLATITAVTPAASRERAISAWALSLVVGGILGLLLCAAAVDLAGWHASFLVIAALAVVCLLATAAVVPETFDAERVRFDVAGVVLSILAVGGLVFAVTEGPVAGWSSAATLAGAVVGALALVGFVAWELRVAHPLLDVRLLADRRFGASALTLLLLFWVNFGLVFLAFQYQSYVLGYGSLHSALGFVPSTIGLVIAAPLGPLLARRMGQRRVLVAAILVAAAGALLAAATGGTGAYGWMAGAAFLIWTGLGLGMATPTTAILRALPPERQGVGSAVNDLARELGAALGIATMGSAFTAAYQGRVRDLLGGDGGAAADAVRRSPSAGLEALASTPDDRLVSVLREGVFAGWHVAFLAVAVLLVVGAAVVARRHPLAGDDAAASGDA